MSSLVRQEVALAKVEVTQKAEIFGEMLVDRVEDVARGALDKVQVAARQMTSEGQQNS